MGKYTWDGYVLVAAVSPILAADDSVEVTIHGRLKAQGGPTTIAVGVGETARLHPHAPRRPGNAENSSQLGWGEIASPGSLKSLEAPGRTSIMSSLKDGLKAVNQRLFASVGPRGGRSYHPVEVFCRRIRLATPNRSPIGGMPK
jgi:hypothetical protein